LLSEIITPRTKSQKFSICKQFDHTRRKFPVANNRNGIVQAPINQILSTYAVPNLISGISVNHRKDENTDDIDAGNSKSLLNLANIRYIDQKHERLDLYLA